MDMPRPTSRPSSVLPLLPSIGRDAATLIEWMSFDGAKLLFLGGPRPETTPESALGVWWVPGSGDGTICLRGDTHLKSTPGNQVDLIFWSPSDTPLLERYLPLLRPRGRVLCLNIRSQLGALPGSLEEGSRWGPYALLRPKPAPLLAKPRVSVIVPTRNEVGNVDEAARSIPLMGSHTEILFVDGASTDGTWQRIETHLGTRADGATLRLIHQVPPVSSEKEALAKGMISAPGRMLRLGKGDAVRKGFAAATGDILMILDSDLTVAPSELPRFYRALVEGEGDVINGCRLSLPMEAGAMRALNKLGNRGFARIFSHILRQEIGDTLCGTKVLWAEDWRRIAAGRSLLGEEDPFGDFDILLGAARLGLKVSDVEISYRARTFGEIKIQRVRHGMKLCRVTGTAWWRMRRAGL